MVLAVFEFFGFVQNSCFSLCLFRLIFLFEKSLVPKYLQCLALKEKSIIFIIVATKSTKRKVKSFFFFSAARSFRNSNNNVQKKIKNFLLEPSRSKMDKKKAINENVHQKLTFCALLWTGTLKKCWMKIQKIGIFFWSRSHIMSQKQNKLFESCV